MLNRYVFQFENTFYIATFHPSLDDWSMKDDWDFVVYAPEELSEQDALAWFNQYCINNKIHVLELQNYDEIPVTD